MHMHMHMHSTTWFEESLQSLGHYDPLIARKALTDDDDSFRQITLWLEDRVIRLWDLKARERLRNNFWSYLVEYLDQLECPSDYTAGDDWNQDKHRRTRVLYWLVSCAISETHGDSSSAIATTVPVDASQFPLGFTTDDLEVDKVLTYIRMKHVLKLRQEQDQINDCIGRLQQTSVETSKPLKNRKR